MVHCKSMDEINFAKHYDKRQNKHLQIENEYLVF